MSQQTVNNNKTKHKVKRLYLQFLDTLDYQMKKEYNISKQNN